MKREYPLNNNRLLEVTEEDIFLTIYDSDGQDCHCVVTNSQNCAQDLDKILNEEALPLCPNCQKPLYVMFSETHVVAEYSGLPKYIDGKLQLQLTNITLKEEDVETEGILNAYFCCSACEYQKTILKTYSIDDINNNL